MKFKSCRHIEWDNRIDEIFGEDYVKSEITDNLLEEIRKHVTTYIDNEPNELYRRTYYAEVDLEVRDRCQWICVDEELHEDYVCSNCGYAISTFTANIKPSDEYKYCPNCGGRMESEEE